MQNTEREALQLQLIELNQKFLAEVERGAGWKELQPLLAKIKLIAKGLDHMPETIVSFNTKYPIENSLGESGT
jgi:hypothetical protein